MTPLGNKVNVKVMMTPLGVWSRLEVSKTHLGQ